MSQIAVRQDHQDGQRHRKNHPDGKYEPSWFWFLVPCIPPGRQIDALWRTLEGRIGEMCELLHTRTPGIASQCFLAAACGGNSMNNLSQPPQPTEPDMALLYLGSFVRDLGLHAPRSALAGQ